MSLNFKKHWPVAVIAVIYLLMVVVVSPYGEFPLNDDWSYSQSVNNFLNGNFNLSHWTAASAVFHIFWGYLFSLLFGFSFTVLRISTIVMSFFGALGLYLLLSLVLEEKIYSLLGTLVLVFNPLYIYLTYSFMTDVTFITTVIWSSYFYCCYFNSKNRVHIWLGSLFAAFAILTRQFGIFLPFSFFTVFLIKKGLRSNLNLFLPSVLVPLLSFLLYQVWVGFIHGPTFAYQACFDYTFNFIFRSNDFIPEVAERLLGSVIYFGFFTIPLTIGILSVGNEFLKLIWKRKYLMIISVLTFTVFVYWQWVTDANIMPYFANVLTEAGFFPHPLYGHRPPVFYNPYRIKLFWTALSIVSSCILVSFLLPYLFKKISQYVTASVSVKDVFLIVVFLLLFIANTLYSHFYDRYLVQLLPFVLLFIISRVKKMRVPFVIIILALLICAPLGIIFEYDYVEWNKARWDLGRSLLQQGVAAKNIDGGFEWNCWYNFEREVQSVVEGDRGWSFTICNPENAEYKLSFVPASSAPGDWNAYTKKHFTSPLGFDQSNYVYVLVRD